MSRQHAAGADSARGLLFTVLGELVLTSDGQAWTSAFIEVLGRLGVEAKATRQALTRTAAAGWLEPVRIGRRTRWQLTGSGQRLLVEGTERIYGFPNRQADWDGQWLMVLARVPESDRPTRHRLRTRLAWAGFGSPAPGVWVSPDGGRSAEAERVLAEAGLIGEAQLFLARHHAGELAAMVGQAWDLAAIEHSYREFIIEFESAGDQAGDPLTRVIELVHAWRRFPSIDPALPADLLPTPWSGSRAASLFAQQHARYSTAARAEWARLNSEGGGRVDL